MPDDALHVRFTEAETVWHVSLPVASPWRRVTDALPADGSWCWVWHTAWDREEGAILVRYWAPGHGDTVTSLEHWWAWTHEGYLSTDQLTHWQPAQVPEPPGDEG